jgi:hypothetical protein
MHPIVVGATLAIWTVFIIAPFAIQGARPPLWLTAWKLAAVFALFAGLSYAAIAAYHGATPTSALSMPALSAATAFSAWILFVTVPFGMTANKDHHIPLWLNAWRATSALALLAGLCYAGVANYQGAVL